MASDDKTKPRYDRRLSDKIMIAHDMAVTESKEDVADLLIQALELDLSGIGGTMAENRTATQALEDTFERHESFKKVAQGTPKAPPTEQDDD